MGKIKDSFAGTRDVFRFTFLQQFKGKSGIAGLVMLIVMALAMPPVTTLLQSGRSRSSQISEALSQDTTADLPGLTKEQTEILGRNIETSVMSVSQFENRVEDDFDSNYFLQLIYSIAIMMVSIMAVSYIIRSVVEEKTSKLVEFLMVSVRPAALLTGKILAVLLYVFVLVGLAGGAYMLSSRITSMVLHQPAATLSSIVPGTLVMPGPVQIIAIIISFALACLTFSLLAGLCGAGCSTQEDVNSAMGTPMMLIMGCYFIAIVTSALNNKAVNVIVSVFPLISCFCGPVQFMRGKIGIVHLVIAWLAQAAVIWLLVQLTAKVYSDLIVYKGSRRKFMDIVRMALPGKGVRVS